jgi:hypothetical protein
MTPTQPAATPTERALTAEEEAMLRARHAVLVPGDPMAWTNLTITRLLATLDAERAVRAPEGETNDAAFIRGYNAARAEPERDKDADFAWKVYAIVDNHRAAYPNSRRWERIGKDVADAVAEHALAALEAHGEPQEGER